ncbi:MAG: response regulator, partial [Gammaproteobacteria bacterium]|nr:response regulator [Gammaproteobacteria bacterium]
MNTDAKPSILIVEDDRATRKILAKYIDTFGYSVAVADNGETAADLLDEGKFDLLLLDLNLPGLSGFDLIKTIRQKYSLESLPILVISTADDNKSIIAALQGGANDYVCKPVDSRMLVARIRTHLIIKDKVDAYLEIKEHLEILVDQKTDELNVLNKHLQKEQKLLDHLLSYSTSITYINSFDSNHDCSFISKNVESILGYVPAQILDSSFWDSYIHPHDKQTAIKNIHKNIKSGGGNVEYRIKHADGSYIWLLDQHLVLEENDFQIGIIGSLTDISSEKVQSAENNSNKKTDEVTGLINRNNFEAKLENLSSWSDSTDHVLCYIDLDNFKVISRYGQVAGRELLRQISEILKAELSKRDIIASLGSDEFGVLLQSCTMSQAMKLMQNVLETLSEYRFNWEGRNHVITASIGMVSIDQHINNLPAILSTASLACDMAKEQGRNQIYVYTNISNPLKDRQQEMIWVGRINQSIEEDRILLYYQPISGIKNNNDDMHFEILIRLKDHNNEIIFPGSFLPAAERYNLSVKIDHWVFQTITSWLEAYPEYLQENYQWGINLSGQTLADKKFLQFVLDVLEYKQIPLQCICFEITETAVIANLENAK